MQRTKTLENLHILFSENWIKSSLSDIIFAQEFGVIPLSPFKTEREGRASFGSLHPTDGNTPL
jgi:hypothetical protein